MGTASLRLHDGTVVTARFDDNADGQVQNDERSRAQSALRAELTRLGRSGSEIDDSASIFILEDGEGVARESSLPAGDLARTGAVRLFGSNPVSGTDMRRAMWAPVATEIWNGGDRHVIYHEANRWDEASQQIVNGRTVRVNQQGDMFVLTDVPAGQDPWRPLSQYTPPSGMPLIPTLRYIAPQELVSSPPPADGSFHKVMISSVGAVTPRAWTAAGTPRPDGYQYFSAPGGNIARRSVANPTRDEVMVARGSGQDPLAGAVWRAADDADAVPALPPAPPPPPVDQVVHTPDRGRDITMRALTGDAQFMTVGGVRYEVLQTADTPPIKYRRTAPEAGPRGTQFQREDRPGHWAPVGATAPRAVAPAHARRRVWE